MKSRGGGVDILRCGVVRGVEMMRWEEIASDKDE